MIYLRELRVLCAGIYGRTDIEIWRGCFAHQNFISSPSPTQQWADFLALATKIQALNLKIHTSGKFPLTEQMKRLNNMITLAISLTLFPLRPSCTKKIRKRYVIDIPRMLYNKKMYCGWPTFLPTDKKKLWGKLFLIKDNSQCWDGNICSH